MNHKDISPKQWNDLYPIGTHVRYTNSTLGVVIDATTVSVARYFPGSNYVHVALNHAPIRSPWVRIDMLEVLEAP